MPSYVSSDGPYDNGDGSPYWIVAVFADEDGQELFRDPISGFEMLYEHLNYEYAVSHGDDLAEFFNIEHVTEGMWA